MLAERECLRRSCFTTTSTVRPRASHRWIALPAIVLAMLLGALAPGAAAVTVSGKHGGFVTSTPITGSSHGAQAGGAISGAHGILSSSPAIECFGPEACGYSAEQQPLRFFGLGVMPTTTDYLIYWDPASVPFHYAPGYSSGITKFFKGLEHDNGTDQNFYSALTQYGLSYETHVGKSLKVKDPYPAPTSTCEWEAVASLCLTPAQIGAEIVKLIKAHKLPQEYSSLQAAEAEPNPHNAYFVVLPPGVFTCIPTLGCNAGSRAQFCAYHGLTEAGDAELEGSEPFDGFDVYAVQPYVDQQTGCDYGQHPNGVSDSALSGGMVHEFAEMITDPLGSGWLNTRVQGEEEVADICWDEFWAGGNTEFAEKMRWGAPLGKAANGALYNQVIDGRDYYLPQMYSNEAKGCRQRRALPPVVTKIAPVAGPLAGNVKVKITGKNFTSPSVTAVDFGGTAAKSFSVSSPTSLTAVAPAATAAGPVEVTVATSAGRSAVVESDRFTYEAR